jgi:hypothetical protein
MSTNISIEEFVLGYCREVDGLIEPPAFGSHEVLLPDEVAERWKVPAHQRLAFAPETADAVYIHFSHPMVETIVDEVRTKIANARFFINHVRLEKPHLFEVIEKSISLPNAKLFALSNANEKVNLHHYVCFNFKVSLTADEKRELILPIWMDLQGGFPVNSAEIERLATLDEENLTPALSPAALTWDGAPPLSPQALSALLERARLSAPAEIGDTLSGLLKRLQRFLELDRARLNDYYDDLTKDGQRRLAKADEDRRPALESKLAAIASERQSKLFDVEQKYHLHVQLELINFALIAQPKIDLMVEIRTRKIAVKRLATWDPLRHVVEGFACDACTRSGQELVLCDNSHLVHNDCLAPQCVDCKRVFCKKCAGEVKTCAVCARPVCIHSLIQCKQCGKTTCREHTGACHAAADPASNPPAQPTAANQPAKSALELSAQDAKGKAPAHRESAIARPAALKSRLADPDMVRGDSMEVISDPAENTITAVIKAKKREVATREWRMTDEGIGVNCWCEKKNCDKRNLIYRPFDLEHLPGQMIDFIEEFAGEYSVPLPKISYFHIRQGQSFVETKLRLPTQWRDEAVLERARTGFEALRRRNRGLL